MTDPSSNSDRSPSLDERQRWQSAMVLFEALQDLAPEVRDARLRGDPPAADVLAMLQRMFAAIGETCVLDHPLSGALPGEADDGIDNGMAALKGRRLGRWLLLEPLGNGGMSTVWRARSLAPPLGQISALKLMRLGAASEAGRARFAREIDILAGLRHPGIAAVYDAGHAEDGTPWFAMALVEGDTIDVWCQRQDADLETRVDLVRQAAEAAAHAHRHLVVHRDIKPGNVMVDAAGRATLLDFGISRLLEEADGQASIAAAAGDDGRSARTYAFTPRYAAPEQLRGDALTTATDVYGLGALLHQLLLGAPPASSGRPSRRAAKPAPRARRKPKPPAPAIAPSVSWPAQRRSTPSSSTCSAPTRPTARPRNCPPPANCWHRARRARAIRPVRRPTCVPGCWWRSAASTPCAAAPPTPMRWPPTP